MTEDEWNRTCDGFRDPRVWWIEKGRWWKENLWGEPSDYGQVVNPDVIEKYRKLGRVQ
jgi:hypothetical protein